VDKAKATVAFRNFFTPGYTPLQFSNIDAFMDAVNDEYNVSKPAMST
jgi:hypothetical protein